MFDSCRPSYIYGWVEVEGFVKTKHGQIAPAEAIISSTQTAAKIDNRQPYQSVIW